MRAPLALLSVALLGGCVVDAPPLLDEGFFACASPSDCGPGQGCAEGNVYSLDFCRPSCSRDDPSSCPNGVCTAAGACLDSCRIEADGTPVGCAEDFTCVRTDAIRDLGVCYPVEGCSRSSDCADEEQLCLNDALGLPATSGVGVRFDNLYCTARADDEGRCPQGYLSFRFADPDGGTTPVCYPPCDPTGGAPFCPPATTCFRGFGEITGSPGMPPCLPGVWGLPCLDDTQCLVGRCLDVGEGRMACTETCADADTLAGGCAGLSRFASSLGVETRMRCDGQADPVCVPEYDLLALCDDSLACVGGADTVCESVQVDATTVAHLCLRFCVSARDCATEAESPASYRCLETAGPSGICLRRRGLGGRCSEDLDCLEGVCCDVGGFSACQRSCDGG